MNSLFRSSDCKWFNQDPFSLFQYNWGSVYPSSGIRSPDNLVNKLPAVELKETESGYQVIAELPGNLKDDLEVTIDDNILKIVVHAEEDEQIKSDERVLLREGYQGLLTRSFKLGDSLDREHIQAKFKDGVLNIVIPKKEHQPPHMIDITCH